jgi:Cu(I)/Ag(I) efflux system membrane fusion protein
MKKALILIGVLAMALGITWLMLRKSGSARGRQEEKDAPLEINSKTSAFNRSFAGVLNSYYELSDGFAETDTSLISSAAGKLSKAIDSIRFDQFKADTAIVETAFNLAQSMHGEIAGLNGETKMEQKKREFNMITDQLYSLIRTVRYDGSTIYHMHCSMAFPDSSEAYWLSPTNKIVNPYLGKNNPVTKNKMQDCGEVSDSIRFSAP